MNYIALFRGINVGGKNKVEMHRLKNLFEFLGFDKVESYINSGNIFFNTIGNVDSILKSITDNFKNEFEFIVPILVKSQNSIIRIAKAIPNGWENNKEQKTDVAFLFPEINSADILEQLPINKEFINVHFTDGAVIWNVERKFQNKSQLNKLASNKLYKFMTVRNVNTARYLANW